MKYRHFIIAVIWLLVAGNCFALKPRKEYIMTPDSLHLKYKEMKLSTPDNFQINTWIMSPAKGTDNKTVMIVAYGDAMNMSYWIEQCQSFVQAGFTVITFDYRGFGKSSAFSIDSNQLYYNEFATDLVSVLAFARAEFKTYKVGVRAMSMGTIMAVLAANNTPFDFFIGDSFVCDPVAMENKFLKDGKAFTLPSGAEKYKGQLSELKMPMLVFAGTRDNFTTAADSKTMVDRGNNRKLVTYEGGHLQGFYMLTAKTFGDLYIADVVSFLQRNKILK